MNEQKLQRVVDLILHSADEGDLELLQAAVEQRKAALRSRQLQPGEMAREMAENIGRQVEQSLGQVQGVVRETVEEIIRRKAPELNDEQIGMLLRAWLPGRSPAAAADGGAAGEGPAPGPSAGRAASPGALPADALLAMVRQFVAFSSGVMSVSEQAQLRDAIPDWPRLYWERFPDSVRRLVRDLLQERIGIDQFWQRLNVRLSPR